MSNRGYQDLGCWKLLSSHIAETLEGKHEDLDGPYWNRLHSVLKCAIATNQRGSKLFAVRNGECLAVNETFRKNPLVRRSNDCSRWKGSQKFVTLYKITGSLHDLADFEGDLLLTKSQMKQIYGDGFNDVANYGQQEFLWPERTVVYHIPPSLVNHHVAQRFLVGMRVWANRTCIRFVEKDQHRDWVELFREQDPKSRRCASSIGHIGRYQLMRLGDWCPQGSVIHEWGHTIGFWHTQSRADRDNYVKIIWENILTGKEDQFMKHSHDLVLKLGLKYDYLSIMHYGQSTFGKLTANKQHYMRTIETIDKTYQNLIGQRKAPSKADIEAANLLYGCPDFPYLWRTGDWSECSKSCGSGIKERKVFCAHENSRDKRVSGVKCRHTQKPKGMIKCYGKHCKHCPSGWLRFNYCCYKIYFNKTKWDKAREVCRGIGADLLTLRSDEEEYKLRKKLQKVHLNTIFFWLGARYHPSKGAYKWIDETTMVYNAWAEGEPRWDLDCAILLNKRYWGTDSCTRERSFICKKELNGYQFPNITQKVKHYRWEVGDWGECSVSCGGGEQNRNTSCVLPGRKNVNVDYSFCKAHPAPDAWRACKEQPCPNPYKWFVGPWSECSVTCGGGVMTRNVTCAKEDLIPTSYEMCDGKPPRLGKYCNTQPCPPGGRKAAGVSTRSSGEKQSNTQKVHNTVEDN